MTIDYNELKKGGFLRQRQKDTFIVRFRSIAGNLTSDQLRKLADLADTYGKGYVHVTTRQGAEIPWVKINDYDNMKKEITNYGLTTGTCGPRIRTVVACPGLEVCQNGLTNSRACAEELDKAFFGRPVPMKTKIGICGCPNSCSKPQENDIGLVGVIDPVLIEDKCIGCGLCERVCPGKAIEMVDGKPVLNRKRCLFEGNCISSCPVDAWEETRRGYLLYVGGKIGRLPVLGKVAAEFLQEDEVIEAVERTISAFERLGQQGERIADTVARVGLDAFKEEINILDIESKSADTGTEQESEVG